MREHASVGADRSDWVATLAKASARSECRRDVALILSVFLGYFGVDRFYLGYTSVGILKAITLGACGWWWLLDIVLLATGRIKDADGATLV